MAEERRHGRQVDLLDQPPRRVVTQAVGVDIGHGGAAAQHREQIADPPVRVRVTLALKDRSGGRSPRQIGPDRLQRLAHDAVVLWNTRYLARALDQLPDGGAEVWPEDVARLAPLGYSHINLLGRYSFVLAEPITRGELRTLRDPSDPEEQTFGFP